MFVCMPGGRCQAALLEAWPVSGACRGESGFFCEDDGRDRPDGSALGGWIEGGPWPDSLHHSPHVGWRAAPV
jgi:hypothetical protein